LPRHDRGLRPLRSAERWRAGVGQSSLGRLGAAPVCINRRFARRGRRLAIGPADFAQIRVYSPIPGVDWAIPRRISL
jgi:hypothetical protein